MNSCKGKTINGEMCKKKIKCGQYCYLHKQNEIIELDNDSDDEIKIIYDSEDEVEITDVIEPKLDDLEEILLQPAPVVVPIKKQEKCVYLVSPMIFFVLFHVFITIIKKMYFN